MKSKLDGKTIHCPQNLLELAASDTLAFQDNFYGPSLLDSLRYTFNGTATPVMFDDSLVTYDEFNRSYIKIKPECIRFLDGFSVSKEMIDGTKR